MAIRLGLLTADLGAAGTGINNAVRGIVQTTEGDVEAFVKRLTDPREILVESVPVVKNESSVPAIPGVIQECSPTTGN